MNPMRTRLGSTPSDSQNIFRARTFLILVEFVFDYLALFQGAKSVRLNGGEVDEDIAIHNGIGDETEPLLLVEPLDCSSGHIRLRLIFFQSMKTGLFLETFFECGAGVNRRFATILS
jgi:hypothetical protein